ncbi:EF hand [Botrimarina colliarenosi]|uniref:EF hand n=1 Tax=Botrimarina colliarenosi TaxID=2528001 RepID=A0A5C6A7G4_9BACT|nr:hypothetical protein [Botrimarina colliarenosi]TWT95864.1 EF hand [Botrimarina colliarenosi]
MNRQEALTTTACREVGAAAPRMAKSWAAALLGCLVMLQVLATPNLADGQERGSDRGRRRGRDRSREEQGADRRDDRRQPAPEPASAAASGPLSFGAPKAVQKARGFASTTAAASTASPSSERDRAYARGLLTKYDLDGDRVLSEDEWSKISGDPGKADANNDKRITYDELVARVMQKRREKQATSVSTAGGDLRTYRLQTATEKLPDGLPSWFAQRDKDGDGQVAMHEWSRSWNSSTVRDFTSKDANGDGLITADEALESAR